MQAGHHEAIRCGARCDLCPLANEWGAGPVLGEHPQGAQVLVIDQEPTRTDVKSGRPFAGVDGSTLDAALESAGWSPTDVAREYVVACVPPGGDIRAYEQKLATKNKRAVKAGEQPTPLPTACCEGRLKNAVARYAKVIPMGTVASAATIPGWRGGIDKGRGTLRQAPERKFLPTHRPFRVMKDREWLPAWYGDFQRARRWFDGVELYAPATVFYRPTPEQLEHFLFGPYAYAWRGQRVHVYDVETDGLKATEANLRCIGIGTPSWAVVVPWQPVAWRKQRLDGEPLSTSYTSDEGPIDLYSEAEFKQIAAIISRWATDPAILKAGHNSGVYDRLHMEAWFGVTPAPILDNILLHRNAAPDLPHDLGTVASIYNDVRDWKGAHTAVHAQYDTDLWSYNAEDVVNTARALEPVFAEVERRGQVHMLRIDHVSQSACVGMHRNGMLIDEEERLRRDVELKAKIKLWSTRATDALARSGVDLSAVVKRSKKADEHNEAIRRELLRRGEETSDEGLGLSAGEREDEWALPSPDQLGLDVLAFNPLSHPQLRAVLWDLWDLPIPTDLKEKDLYTSSGEVSTGDALLRRLLSEDRLNPDQREFIFAVRMMRRWSKLWGTYIQPMRPWTGDPKRDAGCRVWADGRVHANWQAHTPITGRFASSGPNVQNWEGSIKAMVVAGSGHLLLGADADQLELRIAASLWGAAMYLEAFERGLDPHQMTMQAVFGRDRMMAFQGAPSSFGAKDFKKKSQFENMRKLAKAIQYASQYGATTETVFRLVTAAEDKETGAMVFANLTLAEVAVMHENWKAGCPEFVKGWDRELAEVRAQGYLLEPVSGRRRDYHDGGRNLSEVVNFKVQAGAASIMNKALEEIVAAFPFGCFGANTGLINQCHDALTLEVPVWEAKNAADVLQQVMTRTESCFPGVTFTTEAAIAPLTVWDAAKGKHVESEGGRSRWHMT